MTAETEPDMLIVYDKMGGQAQYANGVQVSYSLTTYYEGYRIALNGTKGRMEAWNAGPGRKPDRSAASRRTAASVVRADSTLRWPSSAQAVLVVLLIQLLLAAAVSAQIGDDPKEPVDGDRLAEPRGQAAEERALRVYLDCEECDFSYDERFPS